MEFVIETQYDWRALSAMNRGLRKTIRAKRSRWAMIFGGSIVALVVLLAIFDVHSFLTTGMAVLVLAVLIWQDAITGYITRRRMLPGLERVRTVFREEGFTATTELGATTFQYGKIEAIAEVGDYFVFAYSPFHAQVYDKRGLSGGTAEEFRAFLERVAGKNIVKI